MGSEMRRVSFSAWVLNFLMALAFLLFATRVSAFALLGPYADWMTETNGYRQPGDIGGPMDLGEGYRWNVPVVTYAFDQSFLEYFGSNGVAAVEKAVGIINDLPPASSLDSAAFPLNSRGVNYRASACEFYDLKSATLALLLEQLGLAQPQHNVFSLRQWSDRFLLPYGDQQRLTFEDGLALGLILQRNFGPESVFPSTSVNGSMFAGYLQYVPPFADAVEAPLDGWEGTFPSAADWLASDAYGGGLAGGLLTGLSRDDAGGLHYLLNSNNVNPEILLPDVHGVGTNAGACVNFGLRPGIEKITFTRQEYDSVRGQFTPTTNDYTDTYIANGVAMQQQVRRIITEPDFLFSAANADGVGPDAPMYIRTGTTNWWSSAALVGSGKGGPGIVRPGVRITFKKSARFAQTSDTLAGASTWRFQWASFDRTTNAPFAYLSPTASSGPMSLRLHLITGASPQAKEATYEWQLPLPLGGLVALQVSTNLVDWVSSTVVTNEGLAVEWGHHSSKQPRLFFRAIPQ